MILGIKNEEQTEQRLNLEKKKRSGREYIILRKKKKRKKTEEKRVRRQERWNSGHFQMFGKKKLLPSGTG